MKNIRIIVLAVIAIAAMALSGCETVNKTLETINQSLGTVGGDSAAQNVNVTGDDARIPQDININQDGVKVVCTEVIAHRLVGDTNSDYGRKYNVIGTFDAIFRITNHSKRTVRGLRGQFHLFDRHEALDKYTSSPGIYSGSLGGRMKDIKTGKSYGYKQMSIAPGQTLTTKIEVLGEQSEITAKHDIVQDKTSMWGFGHRLNAEAYVFPPNRQYRAELKDVEILFK